MRSIVLVVLVAMALVATPGALACSSSTPTAFVDVPGDGRYYITNDLCQPGCFFSVHLYRETNNQPGLQRADSQVDNTCNGTSASDQRIF